MKQVFLLAALLAVTAWGKAQETEKNFTEHPYIEVTGMAELWVEPDQFFISIVIRKKEDSDKRTLEKIEQEMKTKLTNLGIDVKDRLQVRDLSAEYASRRKAEVSKEYVLVVYDAKKLSEIFDGLKKIGITDVKLERKNVFSSNPHMEHVRIMAIKAARKKAFLLTRALEQEIGKAIYIKEIVEPMGFLSQAMSNIQGVIDSYAGSAGLGMEKIKISARILVRFELIK